MYLEIFSTIIVVVDVFAVSLAGFVQIYIVSR